MDEITIDVKLVEIDKSKKYVFLMDSSKYTLDEIMALSNSVQEWMKKEDTPIVVLWGNGITLLEVEKNE